MCQPGWEESLRENGYMYTYGGVPSLFTWSCHNIVNRLYSDKNSKRKKKKRKESIKQNAKQILQNIEGSLQKTNKQNTEKNKISVSYPQWMWLSWCQVCRLVFPMKILLLVGTSRWMQGLSILVTRPKSNSESWPVDSLKSMHLLIQLILLELLLYYLVAGLGDAEGKERHREIILNSVSLSVKAGGTIGMPASESTTANPPHTLTQHSLTRSFTQ